MSPLVNYKGLVSDGFKINTRFDIKRLGVKVRVEILTVIERQSRFFSNLTSFLENQD